MTEEFTTKEVLTSRGCFGGWFTDMIILFLILSEKLNIHKVKTKSSFVKIFQWPTEVLSTKISPGIPGLERQIISWQFKRDF